MVDDLFFDCVSSMTYVLFKAPNAGGVSQQVLLSATSPDRPSPIFIDLGPADRLILM